MSSEMNTDQQPEIPDLQPPGPDPEGQPGPAMSRRGLLMLLLVAFTFFLILDLAILAYFLWPEQKNRVVPPPEQPVQEQQSPAPSPPDNGQTQTRPDPAETKRAVAARGRWFDLREEAEAAGIRQWADSEFTGLLASSEEAARTLADGYPDEAARLYEQAAAALQTLLDSRSDRFAGAMTRGRESLARGHAEDARTAFTLALAIRPGDAEASTGLDRAGTLDQVVALYEKGLQQEKDGQYDQAMTLFEQAVRLDPAWERAGQALTRLQNKVRQEQFNRAMGAFYQAMQTGKTKAAGQALAQAARIRADSPAVAQARQELARLRTRQQLDQLRVQLASAREQEAWQQVLDIAGRMLRLDAANGLALAAKEEARQRKELEQRLTGIIAHPERLAEDAVLAEARKIVTAARAVPEPGPRLREQTASAGRIVDQAARPVSVTLQSDGATEVTIYHVGRLGHFARKTVQLRPGRYTVVGIRPGYRDVRRQIVVRAEGNEPLVIRCTETI